MLSGIMGHLGLFCHIPKSQTSAFSSDATPVKILLNFPVA